jgi:integrase
MPYLTNRVAQDAPTPQGGYTVLHDEHGKRPRERAIVGFGLRITSNNARSWVFEYRFRGNKPRMTIGSFPAWRAEAARERAGELRQLVEAGRDPLGERRTEAAAPTLADLAQRYREEHLPRKRSRRDDESLLENDIVPRLGRKKVAGLRHADIEELHREITKRAPIRANRAVAVMSKMLNMAMRWEWCTNNVARGIEKNFEQPRDRYLGEDEMARLIAVLDKSERAIANIVRIALLTGARRGEILSMRWRDVDLPGGLWVKPSASTKQRREHRLPLSGPTQLLLAQIRTKAEVQAKVTGREPSEFVFPSRVSAEAPAVDLKKGWAAICKAATLTGLRFHDLRHQHASILVSGGASLPLIGALLGHSQPATTARYAHLFATPLRVAVERVAVAIEAAGNAKLDATIVYGAVRK